MIFLLIVSLATFLILTAEVDKYVIDKGVVPFHTMNAMIRGLVGFLAILMYVGKLKLIVFTGTLFYVGWWWLLFDVYLNYRRGEPILYVGSTSGDDKLLRSIARGLRIDITIVMMFCKTVFLFIAYLLFKCQC